MKLYTIETGFFKLDGGAMFGVVPKSLWERTNPADANNLCTWAMRCLLVEDGDRLTLIDTGIGTKQDEKFFSHYHLHGDATLDRSLAAPILPPGERNTPSRSELLSTNEWEDIDSLVIYHSDNVDADTGLLSYRETTSTGLSLFNPGLALSGFGMGGEMRVNEGTDENPVWRYYGGGITFNGFETTEILLGKGDETLIVETTADRDEKNLSLQDFQNPRSILAIHGGGGNDTITIHDRGEGALLVYGDTSADGERYSNSTGAVSANGTSFNNPGHDVIDASAMAAKADGLVGVIIDGGEGNDSIKGSQGADQLAGNTGDDSIAGEDGNDHIYGDAAFQVNLRLFAEDQQPIRRVKTYGLSDDAAMFTVLTTPEPGSDDLSGGDDADVILGDHGVISLAPGIRRINTTDGVECIATTVESKGGEDSIDGGTGNDIVLGGTQADTMQLGAGDDIAIGDNGKVRYQSNSSVDANKLDYVRSASYDIGGSDRINGDAGDDLILGGFAADFLSGGTGNDTMLGDNAEVLALTSLATLRASKITTTDTENSTGGNDTLEGNEDDDILIGGIGADIIDGNLGRDLILGDQGVLTSRTEGVTTSPRFRALSGSQLYGSNGEALVELTQQYSGPTADVPNWSNWAITIGDGLDGLYGADYIAGGGNNDTIFGQRGNDTIQGDGSIVGKLAGNGVRASRDDNSGELVVVASSESDHDGDDYIEGGGENDVIFGNLGQDDIIGGNSNLYGLATAEQRNDGADLLFGGAGTDIDRNNLGDTAANGHARDADMILGDNGNIFRIVGTYTAESAAQYPHFNYDNYNTGTGSLNKIIVRAAQLLDYTPGGPDKDASKAATDLGAGDEIHGESGDDFIYGMKGDDALFGDGQDDDLIGGWGHDWISGGSGNDGVLGDDGRIYTSRNSTVGEALYGVQGLLASDPDARFNNGNVLNELITTPGNVQTATINLAGQLKKSINLTPFNVDPTDSNPLFVAANANDIIYGGIGNDWLHGGSGDDAISGAEALDGFFRKPLNNGNALAYNPTTGEFAAYDEYFPRTRIEGFLLNFNASEGIAINGVFSDGDDAIFGDLGNDWLVGGTGRDHLYGGWGDDLLNADDDLGTNGGLNDVTDTNASYEDIAYGGAGRDRLIGNTGGDRLID